jgi:Sjoegren syndrome nuclear autoantigen 1
VNRLIMAEEEEKANVQKQISALQDRLNKLNESVARKIRAREEYDRTLEEANQAYLKIVDSSQTLLQVLRRERETLTNRRTTHS